MNYANNASTAEETVAWIRSQGGAATAIQADITDEKAVQLLIQDIENKGLGPVDILVNNATGPQPELAIEACSWQDYLDQLEFFVKAPLLLTKAVLPAMKEQKHGRIINISSEVVQLGNATFSNYVTAKSAQLGMTRSWASELGAHGITVNLINPGFIPVERHVGIDPTDYLKSVPLGVIGTPSDIGHAVVYLASDEARYITGQSLSVNGGNTFGV